MEHEDRLIQAAEILENYEGWKYVILSRPGGVISNWLSIEVGELFEAFMEGSGLTVFLFEMEDDYRDKPIPDYFIKYLRDTFPQLEIKVK